MLLKKTAERVLERHTVIWRDRNSYRTRDTVRVQQEEGETENSRVCVLTPKVTLLTGMPVGPPLSLSYVFCFSQTHSCLFCCPLQVLRYRARRPPSNVNTKTTHTHIYRHTHLSKHGGWRYWVGWGLRGWGAQGFISGGMLPVSKGTHFTRSRKQMGTPTLCPWISCLHPCSFSAPFPLIVWTILTFLMYPTRFVPFFGLPSHSALLSTSSVPSTFHICCTPTLCVTPTLSLLSPVPACPHVTPIAVSPVCFVTARQSIFF